MIYLCNQDATILFVTDEEVVTGHIPSVVVIVVVVQITITILLPRVTFQVSNAQFIQDFIMDSHDGKIKGVAM